MQRSHFPDRLMGVLGFPRPDAPPTAVLPSGLILDLRRDLLLVPHGVHRWHELSA